MASFKYIARDSSGERREGIVDAASTMDVLGWLQEQDFVPVSIGQISGEIKPVKRILAPRSIRSADMASICRELTTLLDGGIPLTTSLQTIAEDIENHKLQKVLLDLLERVEQGEPFSDCIARHPKVFNQLSYAIILAGEMSGNLSEAFGRLADYFEGRDRLVKKVRAAVTYPIFVFSFLVLIVVVIMAFIIPHFVEIFKEFGGTLPAFTRAFLGFYSILVNNLWWILSGLAILLAVCTFLNYRIKNAHRFFSKLLLRLPLLGPIFKNAFISKFSKTMSSLLASGVPMLDAFDILSQMSKNDVIKDAINNSKDLIEQGSSISLGMMSTEFFPNLVIKMVQVGEDSGSLAEVLEKTAEHYEIKVDASITTLTSLLEPAMIIIVGMIVLVVVVALYLPIFTLSSIIR